MKKYTFLVYHAQYDAFLEKLRQVGVLHVAPIYSSAEEVENLHERLQDQDALRKTIAEVELLLPSDPQLAPATSTDNAAQLLGAFDALKSKRSNLENQYNSLKSECDRMRVWGDFDLQRLQELENAGIALQYFSVPVNKFDPLWEEEYHAFVVGQVGTSLYFVTVNPQPITLEAETITLGEKSVGELQLMLAAVESEQQVLAQEMASWATQHLQTLRAYSVKMQQGIDWERVKLHTRDVADANVKMLEGYCPEPAEEALQSMLEQDHIFYQVDVPEKGDTQVPIKLKNNFFTRLYEVLTKMYGMPDYEEFDPTPLIAPFFTLFFAFCMGDAGYGLVLIALGMILKRKMAKKMAGMMNLVISLGVGTTLLGALFGTFFGIDLLTLDLPQSLKNLMVSGKVGDTSYDKQMLLALLIGVVHICIAMTVKAIGSTVRYGFKASLSAWGWLLLVVGFIATGGLRFFEVISAEVSQWMFIIVGGVSAIGIYLLNNLHRNILKNIGAGLWDTYNMTTGLLGDVLSYIRLYALGLAGAMLGGVFNDLAFMAHDACPIWIGWLPCGIVLIFGHTLNIAMSCLSAFVHPLRLTFLEFFKNAGYNGKGVSYKPFAAQED